MKLYKVEAAIVAVTDGTLSASAGDRLTCTVNPAAATRLVVTGSATQTAGAAQPLTIKATDPYGNTDTAYTRRHNLTFSGANNSTNPATTPTVTNNSAAATNFGSTTAITFTSGVATSGGSMKLYKAEGALVAVTDGTILAGGADRLSVAVSAATASRLVVTGTATQTAGTSQVATITATDPYRQRRHRVHAATTPSPSRAPRARRAPPPRRPSATTSPPTRTSAPPTRRSPSPPASRPACSSSTRPRPPTSSPATAPSPRRRRPPHRRRQRRRRVTPRRHRHRHPDRRYLQTAAP